MQKSQKIVRGFGAALAISLLVSQAAPAEITNSAELFAAFAKMTEPEGKKKDAFDYTTYFKTLNELCSSGEMRAQKDAVEKWVYLYDNAAKLQQDLERGTASKYVKSQIAKLGDIHQSNRLSVLLSIALPSASQWDDLATKLEGKAAAASQIKQVGLRLFIDTLRDNPAGILKTLNELPKPDKANREGHYLSQLVESILAQQTGEVGKAILLRQLTNFETEKPELWENSISLPNLDSTCNDEEITQLMNRVLDALQKEHRANYPDFSSDLPKTSRTLKIALSILESKISEIKNIPWELCENMTTLPLPFAEKIYLRSKELPAPKSNYEIRKFLQLYTQLLIENNNSDKAVELYGEWSKTSFSTWQSTPCCLETKPSQATYDFYKTLLSKNKDAAVWHDFIKNAVAIEKSDDALAFIKQNFGEENISNPDSLKKLGEVYLNLDNIDEGLELLHKAQEIYAKDTNKANGSDAVSGLFSLYQAKKLLAKDYSKTIEDLRQSLIKNTESLDGKNVKDLISDAGIYDISSWSEAEISEILKDVPQYEQKLYAATDKLIASMDLSSRYNYENALNTINNNLLTLYAQQNRHAELVSLTLNNPFSRNHDLNAEEASSIIRFLESYVEIGKKEEALTLLKKGLLSGKLHNNDSAYKLLVKLSPDAPFAFLEKLFQSDAYEERPLIWKAHLLNQAGKFEEAEKLARQAIKIDPSDGEQGKEDRMRVYAVLADSLKGLNNEKDEAQFRKVVTAIRKSEKADDYISANLVSKGVALYQESLGEFADAYCIQSRLAKQLANQGRYEEAEKHYIRAFELMPDSFGFVESHCFGCEGAFYGEKSQVIAERVFKRIVEVEPKKAHTHYLLGYLRNAQEKPEEALVHFQKAAELEPAYLNAWSSILDICETDETKHEALYEIALKKLFELDPNKRHFSFSPSTKGNLKNIVGILDGISGKAEEDSSLLRYEAKKKFERKVANMQRLGRFSSYSYTSYSSSSDDPRAYLLNTSALQNILSTNISSE